MRTRKTDYEDDTSNKIGELINKINKVLDIVDSDSYKELVKKDFGKINNHLLKIDYRI